MYFVDFADMCWYFTDIADMCRYFADFLQSEYHCQHQIDVLTSTKVLLPDILYCDSAMFYFMEVGQRSCVDLVGSGGHVVELFQNLRSFIHLTFVCVFRKRH